MENGFPALGEVARFLFNSTGVLAQKESRLHVLNSERDKKKLQTRLKRLVAEEGDINKNLNDVLQLWVKHIDVISPSPKVTIAIAETIRDLLIQYTDLIRREGTYLDKKQSLYFSLRYSLVHGLANSILKNTYRFNLRDLHLTLPENEYWFLPEIDNDRIVWPIEKALRWTYRVANTSQTHFHYPGQTVDSENFKLKRNLENAENWLHNRNLPSWGALHTNLLESFEAMESCDDEHHKRIIDTSRQKSIIFVFLMARTSTYVTQLIVKHFGRDKLLILIKQLKQRNQLLDAFVYNNIREKTERIISDVMCDSVEQEQLIDAIWYESVQRCWQLISPAVIQAGNYAQQCYQRNHETSLTDQQRAHIRDVYGKLSLCLIEEGMAVLSDFTLSETFVTLEFEGQRLRKNAKSLDDIEKYQQRLAESPHKIPLQWLLEWSKGALYTRKGELHLAHRHLGNALNLGRYCAGLKQKELVKQYLKVCVQIDNIKDFKKAFFWAAYLYIELPWWTKESEDLNKEAIGMYRLYQQNPILLGL